MPSSNNGSELSTTNAPSSASPSSSSDTAKRRCLSADPFLAELANGLPVCFAGIPHAKEAERQQNFLHSAQMARRLHIAIPSSGLNLHLDLKHGQLVPERNEVQFVSDFHFNGTRVRLHGHISVRSLQGKVKVELLQMHHDGQQQQNMTKWLEQRMVQLRAAALTL